jgi:hypothetical protein
VRRRSVFSLLVLALPLAALAQQAPVPKPSGGATVTERKAPSPRAEGATRSNGTLAPAAKAKIPPAGAWAQGTLLGNLDAPFIAEASGIAASRANPGVFWVHNDSGDGAYLYAVGREGKTVGVYLVRSAAAVDWEDIAWGPGPDGKGSFLYVADGGDFFKNRTDCAVYRVPEPKLTPGTTGNKVRPLLTDEPTVRLAYRFPDGSHDVETVMVHPKTGAIYLVTKDEGGVSGVYKFPVLKVNDPLATYTLERVGTLSFNLEGGPTQPYPNRVTGGDIAPDGRRVVLRTYYMGYEWRLPDDKPNFDDIWTQAPVLFALPFTQQGEGICYSPDGRALVTTSEKRPTPLYELRAK